MKLYHYVHCPFCVRVRMGLGLLNLTYESHVVPYNDEKTPVSLTGKKMLPILVDDSGLAQSESLDILAAHDKSNSLNWKFLDEHFAEIEELINKIGHTVHSLCMPYWIWTPEFDDESRLYFQTKKEIKRGPFKNLIHNKETFINDLEKILKTELEGNLNPFYKSSALTIIDIMIAAHLWGMYIFPEFQFTENVHNYLQRVRIVTHFDYHQDFWK